MKFTTPAGRTKPPRRRDVVILCCWPGSVVIMGLNEADPETGERQQVHTVPGAVTDWVAARGVAMLWGLT